MPDLTELTAKDWSDNDDHELIFKLLEIIGCPCGFIICVEYTIDGCVDPDYTGTQ